MRHIARPLRPHRRLNLVMVLFLFLGLLETGAPMAQTHAEISRFPDVAAEIESLGFHTKYPPWKRKIHGYYARSELVDAWKAWLARHGLQESQKSAKAFESYMDSDFAEADKLFAQLTGRPGNQASGSAIGDTRYPQVAAEIAAFGIKNKRFRGSWPCNPGPFDASPCTVSVRSWKIWTERHRLPQNSKSAAAFKAYVIEDYPNADRHYAALMGHTKDAYTEIARRVRALGLREYDGRKESCENNYFSANPCPEAVRLWKAWSAEHDLPLSYRSAGIFQAYVAGDEKRGHLQYALAKGHPIPEFYDGPGNRILALGLQPFSGRTQACENNYFAANPCPKAIRLWKQWAAQEGLELDYQSAATFQAYVNHDFRTGDRLYARAKGLPAPNAYAGPGLNVIALGLQPWDPNHRNKGSCRHNPFSHESCGPESRRAFEAWTEENGVPLDYASAAAFEAYTNYDFERGDRMFAAVKGVSVEELLRTYQGKPPEVDPNKLIIDVYPIN